MDFVAVMNFILAHWTAIVLAAAGIVYFVYEAIRFKELPVKKKVEKIDTVDKKCDDVVESVEKMKCKCAENDAKEARAAILHFGDELIFYPERRYSKDRFDEIAQRITEYDRYCDEHPDFPNHMTQSTSALILNEYQRRMESHEFM